MPVKKTFFVDLSLDVMISLFFEIIEVCRYEEYLKTRKNLIGNSENKFLFRSQATPIDWPELFVAWRRSARSGKMYQNWKRSICPGKSQLRFSQEKTFQIIYVKIFDYAWSALYSICDPIWIFAWIFLIILTSSSFK